MGAANLMEGAGVQAPEIPDLRAFEVEFKTARPKEVVLCHNWSPIASDPGALAIVFVTFERHDDHVHQNYTRALTNVADIKEVPLPKSSSLAN